MQLKRRMDIWVLRRPYDDGCNGQPDNIEVEAKEKDFIFLHMLIDLCVWRKRQVATVLPASGEVGRSEAR